MRFVFLPIGAVFIGTLFMGSVAWGQPPIQFNNTQEALKLYEDSTLDSLRERCSAKKFPDLWAREELQALRNGYVLVNEAMAQPGRYEVFAFDRDKRTFYLIDGQSLERNNRLHLKLALPRDYARCRIVRGSAGAEQLEVVHIERNYPSESLKAQRLLDELRDLAAQGLTGPVPAAQCAVRTGPGTRLNDRMLVQGKDLSLADCGEAQQSLRERLGRVLRKVYER
ncbi:MAG: hypothetical protein Q8R67_17255 [Rhodoferax sp.]|nr:hypothetical protein [Rhodoferax sp.]MDP3653417.1 hypothetical protein [Rhodoferax sp.]